MKTKCIVCDKEFSDYHKPARKYCSQKCYHQSTIGSIRPSMRKRVDKKCVICGNVFETGGRAGKRTVFCSRTCQAIGRIRDPIVNKMTPSNAAYLAGLMDGEGSVTLAVKRKKRTTWRISIANTDFFLLEWCKEITGCGSIVRHVSKNPKHADGGNWQCYSWNARDIMKQILPYMKIKNKIIRGNQLISELDQIIALNKK